MSARRGWWRWAVLVAVFLCAGAVVNVLVAWGCMVWVPASESRVVLAPHEQPSWLCTVPSHWPGSAHVVSQRTGFGVLFMTATRDASQAGAQLPDVWIQSSYSSGWPFIAMESENRVEVPGAGGRSDYWGYGQRYPLWIPGRVMDWEQSMLPLRPVLPGFFLGTLVWAATSFGLAWGCVSLRREARRRRGRCESCGYDLSGTPAGVCPECGQRVRPRGALPLPD
jgi:hypothetical protein